MFPPQVVRPMDRLWAAVAARTAQAYASMRQNGSQAGGTPQPEGLPRDPFERIVQELAYMSMAYRVLAAQDQRGMRSTAVDRFLRNEGLNDPATRQWVLGGCPALRGIATTCFLYFFTAERAERAGVAALTCRCFGTRHLSYRRRANGHGHQRQQLPRGRRGGAAAAEPLAVQEPRVRTGAFVVLWPLPSPPTRRQKRHAA